MGTATLMARRAELQAHPDLEARIEEHRTRVERFLLEDHEYPPNRFDGRGIVTIAGGPRYFPGGYCLVRLLRELGCNLPIQMWCLNRQEIDGHMQALVEGLGPGIEVIDAQAALGKAPRRMGGWELKVWAILQCPWREVLFLDSDNVPRRDPTYLFDSPEYMEAGSVLWPDLPADGGWDISRTAFLSMGLEIPAGSKEFFNPARNRLQMRGGYTPIESGQILVDKSRCWRALQLCRLLNDYSEWWYRWIYGDKSTFALAWMRTQTPCAIAPPCYWFGNDKGGGFHQRDHSGEIVFQHRCQPITKLSIRNHNHHPGGFLHGEKIDSYLAELREWWDGAVKCPPPSWKMRRLPYEMGMWQDIRVKNDYRLPDKLTGTVLDVGAHVGIFADECLRRGASCVVSVEPDDENWGNLCHNLARWGAKSVRIHGAAWSRDEWLSLHRGRHTGEHFTRPGTGGQLCRGIAWRSILDLCGPLTLVKLDCEGAEWELLEMCDWSSVPAICGEWHCAGSEYTAADVTRLMRGHDYSNVELLPHPQVGDVLGLWWASRAAEAGPSQ